MPTRLLAPRPPLALVLPLATLACGDDPGPAATVYEMSAALVSSETLGDGTLRNRYELTVTQGTRFIAGAWMRFEADAGDVSTSSDRTDLSGHGHIDWTLEPADRAGISTATLSGCAQDLAPPDCTSQPLATLSF
jgi:hypothetical protein